MEKAFYLFGGLLLLTGIYGIYIYNSLVRKRARVENGWSQIDVQLKRRYDLIPNLVETVKAYAAHERELFEKIAALRSAAHAAGSPEEALPWKTSFPGHCALF
ncbi:MAG TPA: LemA family protein [Synergistaceae bacterium]|mgnify:CR=1 FL=1|nr:LemA family protein [Synergistaceae bacterium]